MIQTAERVSANDMSDNYVLQRSKLVYHKASEIVSGDILEIGMGSGYGISIISPKADHYTAVDKIDTGINLSFYENVNFYKMKVPPLDRFADNSFDYVVTFQVIEHIEKDLKMIEEISRVLRPSGKLIISTPNKRMSLTRNPWHVREYTPGEFANLLGNYFPKIEMLGVYGNENISAYYQKNKEAVEKISKYDILNLQYRLPRQMLQIPYDILNRLNRKRLLDKNQKLTAGITMEDYYFDQIIDDNSSCFDLFFIASKQSS